MIVSIMENAHTTLAIVRSDDCGEASLWARQDENLWYCLGDLTDDDTRIDPQVPLTTASLPWLQATERALSEAWAAFTGDCYESLPDVVTPGMESGA